MTSYQNTTNDCKQKECPLFNTTPFTVYRLSCDAPVATKIDKSNINHTTPYHQVLSDYNNFKPTCTLTNSQYCTNPQKSF